MVVKLWAMHESVSRQYVYQLLLPILFISYTRKFHVHVRLCVLVEVSVQINLARRRNSKFKMQKEKTLTRSVGCYRIICICVK